MNEALPLSDFRRRTGFSIEESAELFRGARHLVSLRQITRIDEIVLISNWHLLRILRSVRLKGDAQARPYRSGRFRIVRFEPHGLKVGQTFVQKEKIERMQDVSMSGVFSGYAALADPAFRPPLVAIDRSPHAPVASIYIPPIVEEHGHAAVLLDGVHRVYSAHALGQAPFVIVIEDVAHPPPFAPDLFATLAEVDEKPPKAKRYHALRPELFRDLDAVGIDG